MKEPPEYNPRKTPAYLNTTVMAGAALVVIFLIMAMRGGPVAGALAPLIGLLGIVFHWSIAVPMFLLVLSYLLLFPFGIPGITLGFAEVTGRYFEVTDIALAAAVVVYVMSHLRLTSLARQAMPTDIERQRNQPMALLSPRAVEAEHWQRLLIVTGCVVLVGQLGWLLLTNLRVDLLSVPPLKFAGADYSLRGGFGFPISPPFGRCLMLLCGVTVIILITRFGFWYWSLVKLTPDQGQMILLDTQWRDLRREVNRREKWRAWARPGGRYVRPKVKRRRSFWGSPRMFIYIPMAMLMIFALTVFYINTYAR